MEKLLLLIFLLGTRCSGQNSFNYQALSPVISNTLAVVGSENRVIHSKKEADFNISFYAETIKVNISLARTKRLSYLISNIKGETILANSTRLKVGQQDIEINIPNNTREGYYYIQIISDKINKRERFYYKGG
jgi:hypothetical protein